MQRPPHGSHQSSQPPLIVILGATVLIHVIILLFLHPERGSKACKATACPVCTSCLGTAVARALSQMVGMHKLDPIKVLELAAHLREGSDVGDRSIFSPPAADDLEACRDSLAAPRRLGSAARDGTIAGGAAGRRWGGGQTLLAHSLSRQGEVDEYGHNSSFLSLRTICDEVYSRGGFGQRGKKDIRVINLGARDGKGTAGNLDPTYRLFEEGYSGLAVEGDSKYHGQLNHTLAEPFGVKVQIAMIHPQTVVPLVREHFPAIDILKLDIDSWDCDVMPELLKEFHPKVIEMEFNLKFPPPLLVKLRYSVAYDSVLRGHVYECSLAWLTDVVMRRFGYVLAQVDWQNAVFVNREAARLLGIGEEGVDAGWAYQMGVLRPGRVQNLWFNRDVDHLIDNTDAPDVLLRKTEDWFVNNQEMCSRISSIPCATGEAVLGTDCDNLHSVRYRTIARPGNYPPDGCTTCMT